MRQSFRSSRLGAIRSTLSHKMYMGAETILELEQSTSRKHIQLSRAADIHKIAEGHWALFYSGRGWRQAHLRITRQGLKVGMFRTTRQLSLFRSKAAKKKAAKAAKKKAARPRVVKRGRQKGPAMDLSVSVFENKRRGSLRRLEEAALANARRRVGS